MNLEGCESLSGAIIGHDTAGVLHLRKGERFSDSESVEHFVLFAYHNKTETAARPSQLHFKIINSFRMPLFRGI